MKIYTAPEVFVPDGKFTIFLGGSIEMDKAEQWQQELCQELKKFDINILNPRRTSWDGTWEQKMSNPQFNEQVNWELDGLDQADLIVMYLQPNTYSPISLLELGLYARSTGLLVCCPDNFYRAGNVDIVCTRYNHPVYKSKAEMFCKIKEILEKLNGLGILHHQFNGK
ncbi:MAG: nucleoside 2-deoxyribosyltransferase domain-containing protein [Nitrososphaeraceae archaeon]